MKKVESEKVIELRKSGMNYQEIAETTGLNERDIGGACRRRGLGLTKDEVEHSRSLANAKRSESNRKATIEWMKRTGRDSAEEGLIKKLNGRFEYLGGYTDTKCKIELVCGECGNSFIITAQSIRKGGCKKCPICDLIEREERDYFSEMEKLYEANRKAEEREERSLKKKQEQIRKAVTKTCIICGNEFETRDSRRMCCSPECSKTNNNRNMSHRKDSRIASDKRIDKGINARSLFKRDKGVCWICGGQCNLEDYTMRDGYFIAGDWYPSVDHIIPICDGGEDSWKNVKLAHRWCNTARYILNDDVVVHDESN